MINRHFTVFMFTAFVLMLTHSARAACLSEQIDVAGDGTNCIDTKFSLTTSSTDSFKFSMSASGTFYVDCGNGGTLTSTADDVSNKTVVRANTNSATYTCTWQTSDVQTIRFAGLATGYSSISGSAAIAFGTRTPNNSVLQPDLITGISGRLGQIFKSYGRNATEYPGFFAVFANAVNLTSLPANLFSGIRLGEFGFAFEYTGLVEIPENLFSDLSGQPVNGAFQYTFHNCVRLQNIPEKLFKSVPYLSHNIFYATFHGCTALKNIPSGLFSHIKDSTSATTNGNAFYATFAECYNLTSLPEDLFASVTRIESGTFQNTFRYCSKITGYVPPSMFRGLIEKGTSGFSSAWTDIFSGTGLSTTCPTGTTQYITGYEDYWNSKVSCVDESFVCDAGEYLPSHWYQCEECSENSYCVGGNYNYSASTTQGITACNPGYSSPAGSDAASDCTGNVITVTWDGADSEDIAANNADTIIYGGDIRTPKKAQHINGKVFVGWKFDDPQ